mmetsp:Transcript_17284/g.42177  ORF Transcript_17284/g.42177 Transcript_17284/m.42177 type:complete len:288 (+) Transcript_17284:318-1181(+)
MRHAANVLRMFPHLRQGFALTMYRSRILMGMTANGTQTMSLVSPINKVSKCEIAVSFLLTLSFFFFTRFIHSRPTSSNLFSYFLFVCSDLFMLSVPTCYCDHAKPDSCTHFWTSSGPTSGPTTCVDDPLFLDSYGDDCSWYTANEPLGCPNHGTEIGDCTSGTCEANAACCHCIATGPTPAPGVCVDDVSFTDSYGDDCQWYTDNEPPGCPNYGFELGNCTSSRTGFCTATFSCCQCQLAVAATPSPTPAPSSGPTPNPTSGPTSAPTSGPTSGPTNMPTICEGTNE